MYSDISNEFSVGKTNTAKPEQQPITGSQDKPKPAAVPIAGPPPNPKKKGGPVGLPKPLLRKTEEQIEKEEREAIAEGEAEPIPGDYAALHDLFVKLKAEEPLKGKAEKKRLARLEAVSQKYFAAQQIPPTVFTGPVPTGRTHPTRIAKMVAKL